MELHSHGYFIAAAYLVTFTLLFLLVSAYVLSYVRVSKKYRSILEKKNAAETETQKTD